MQIFARMLKVDELARTVTGVIANEARDRSGEVFDYASSKPHFEEWSGGIAKATDGKSVGNVRAQHGNVVAGKLSELVMDDIAKAITVTANIVDDNEWNKVLSGCYGGFSIGGSYVKKWADGDAKRYTAKPTEVSIVDMPCNPDAQFTVVKADGTEELRKFTPVAKSLWSVARLADLVSDLAWARDDAECEAAWEGDASTIPADLREAVKTLGDILVRMAAEEVKELTGQGDALALAAQAEALRKQSEEDAVNEELKKAADSANAELAKAQQASADLQKSLDTATASLNAREAEVVALAKALTGTDAADATGAIELIKALPVPVKAAALVIEKTADSGGPDAAGDLRKQIDAMPEGEEKTRLLIKLAHQSPK